MTNVMSGYGCQVSAAAVEGSTDVVNGAAFDGGFGGGGIDFILITSSAALPRLGSPSESDELSKGWTLVLCLYKGNSIMSHN